MGMLPVSTVTDAMAVLLTEAYAGPPDPTSTWFIDNEPDSGIIGILAGVSAAEASTSVDGTDREGTTIAAHAEHLRWSLANANAELRGEEFPGNWKESWRLIRTDPTEWDRLRQSLRVEFETLCATIQKQDELPGEYLLGAMALLPHAAYHLGNIRQMIERVRAANKA